MFSVYLCALNALDFAFKRVHGFAVHKYPNLFSIDLSGQLRTSKILPTTFYP